MNHVRLIDIANELNITANTVSKALHGKSGVSDTLRKEILATAERLGYIPNQNAKSLRYGQSKLIAIVFDNLKNPYYMIMTDLLFKRLSEKGYDVIIFAGIYDNIQVGHLGNILGRQVDGIITFIEPQKNVLDILKKNHVKIVLLGRLNKSLKMHSVSTDDLRGGYLVGEYFISKKKKNVFYIGISNKIECDTRRLLGLTNGLADHEHDFSMSNAMFLNDKPIEAIADELKEKNADAVFCFNDVIAIQCTSLLKKRNCNMKNILMVGYDDIQEAFSDFSSIATVASNKKELANATVDLLIDSIQYGDKTEQYKHLNFPVYVKECNDF